MHYDENRIDSPGVDIALARVKVKEALEALDRAVERGVVVDRDVLKRWHEEIDAMQGSADENTADALASLAHEMEGFLAI
jgi:hypothetical protein